MKIPSAVASGGGKTGAMPRVRCGRLCEAIPGDQPSVVALDLRLLLLAMLNARGYTCRDQDLCVSRIATERRCDVW